MKKAVIATVVAIALAAGVGAMLSPGALELRLTQPPACPTWQARNRSSGQCEFVPQQGLR